MQILQCRKVNEIRRSENRLLGNGRKRFSISFLFREIVKGRDQNLFVNPIEVLIKSPQFKNDNIANFIWVLSIELNKINKDSNFKINTSKTHIY